MQAGPGTVGSAGVSLGHGLHAGPYQMGTIWTSSQSQRVPAALGLAHMPQAAHALCQSHAARAQQTLGLTYAA